MNLHPSSFVILFLTSCVGSVAFGQPIPNVPPAVVVGRAPDKQANGERPWAELPETEVAKIVAGIPSQPEVPVKQPRKVLAFYRTDGYPHTSIPHWNKLLQLLGEKTGAYEVTLSQNYDDLMPGRIEKYDALFFNNTCRMSTPPEVKTAIQAFVKGGKGFVGNHGAGDNWHDWADGMEMIGAEFTRHPFGRIQIKVDDPASPLTAVFGGKPFPYSDEIYAFKNPYSRDGVRVLLSIDYANSPEVAKAEQRFSEKGGPDAEAVRPDKDYALAWVKPWGKGRVFYCALGHRAEVTFDPAIVRFFLAGIQYACGDLAADDKPMGQPAPAPVEPPAAPAPAPFAPPAAAAPPAAKVEPQPEIFADLVFPEGFDVTAFAAPPMMNSPVCVSVTADGVLFVASDPNGSGQSTRGVGKIFRLVDKDDDGRADTVTEFATGIDSPRGIVAEGNTAYLLHPPFITAFTDTNGDGVADEQKMLVKGVGWGLDDRRADHGSNGLTVGVDGWIYAAIGDFGFLKAEGLDGRATQLRGGGVVRVRRDGTGLEVYAAGTRNIFEVAMSPLLDGFARDNTNDGGGWNVRFHYISGLEDHGYPRLFKNFSDEIVAPIVDYGGGSGCGAVWVAEPGWPDKWNNQPIEADWGRQVVYGHHLAPKGAGYEEPTPPAEFCKLKEGVTRNNAFRPTDLDIDACGRLFLVSWRDGGFGAGPKCGFIFRLQPQAHLPPQLPEWNGLRPSDLAKLIESPSQRTRMEAQRRLLAKGLDDDSRKFLSQLAAKADARLECRVAAIFTLAQSDREKARPVLVELARDPAVSAWAIRSLVDDERLAAQVPIEPVQAGLASQDARTRREAAVAVARIGNPAHGSLLAPLLGDADPLIRHTAMRALARLEASAVCFAILDSTTTSPVERSAAVQAIGRIHTKAAVDGLIERLGSEQDPVRRQSLLSALCRLEQRDGEWKGDSWGTVPDTRGPYYQPERWTESDRIDAAIVGIIDRLNGEQAAWLAGQLAINRVSLAKAIDRMVAIAEHDPTMIPPLVHQLAQAETIPPAAMPMLLHAATEKTTPNDLRNRAIRALSKADSADAINATLAAFLLPNGGDEYWKARFAFLDSPHLATHRQILMDAATKTDGMARFAEEALMKIVVSPSASPQAREEVTKALEEGWSASNKRQRQIISAARDTHTPAEFLARRIAPLVKSDDDGLAKLAKHYFAVVNLKPDQFLVEPAKPTGPLVSGLSVDEATAAAVAAAGDHSRGEQLFLKLQCGNCHTVAPGQPPKGPNLANTAAIYTRKELATAVLEPSKTIAQGFATNLLMLEDGRVLTGFVTREAAESVVLRLGDGQEVTVKKEEIADRQKLEGISVMPAGLVANITTDEFGSLLTYLQSFKPANP